MGGLHLSTATLARTQRRLDFRLMSASVLFLLAIVLHNLYEHADYAPLRPLLLTFSLQMLLPAVCAVALDIAQYTCIRPRPRRSAPMSVDLIPSLDTLFLAVATKVTDDHATA